jgi:hypothetical protein
MAKPSPPRLKLALAAALSLLALQIGICQNPPETDPRLVGTWETVRICHDFGTFFEFAPLFPGAFKPRIKLHKDGTAEVYLLDTLVSKGRYWVKRMDDSLPPLIGEFRPQVPGLKPAEEREIKPEYSFYDINIKQGYLYLIGIPQRHLTDKTRMKALPSNIGEIIQQDLSILILRPIRESDGKP